MQQAYERTSVSLPTHLMGYLRDKSEELGAPVSRLIAAALREKIDRETKTKRGGKK
jgi:metal-responsive CopG/Arc/MetJ family transcriptional regulator